MFQIQKRVTRRAFGSVIASSASAAAISLTSGQSPEIGEVTATREKEASGWIDAHVHVWTPDVNRYPLADSYTTDAMKPASFTPEQLFRHCRPSGVDRIVLIQMSFYEFDNRYMLDVLRRFPGVFAGVAIVDHHANGLAEKVRQLKDHGVTGFRIHARGDQASRWPTDDGMAELWRLAADEGLAVCPLINPTDIAAVAQLSTRFPQTRVVVDHFARVGISGTVRPRYLDQLCKLARHRNVHVKASAYYALGNKQPPYLDLLPMIRRVVDAFGPQRVMWASDCPYQVNPPHTYEASIALIRDHADFLDPSDKRALLRDTADRVFFR
jgi:predicted TIM-barrel fold metal-dependent hydrolase